MRAAQDASILRNVNINDDVQADVLTWARNISCFCESDCRRIVSYLGGKYGGHWTCVGQKGSGAVTAMTNYDGGIAASTKGWHWSLYVKYPQQSQWSPGLSSHLLRWLNSLDHDQ